MGAAGWLGKLALKELLKRSPQIMETASQVYQAMKNRQEGVSTEPVAERVEQLEQLHAQQAETIAALARQVDTLTKLAEVQSKRLTLALAAAALSLCGLVLLLLFR